MDYSKLFRLDFKDVGRGFATAFLSAVVVSLASLVQSGTFDLFALDWVMTGKIGLSAGVGYLLKNFLSDSNGKLGGVL